jgi:acetoacetyl-CoA synthetase
MSSTTTASRCAATKGELVCTKPFPVMPIGFWNDDDGKKYRAAYFERFANVWCHGDFSELTAHDGMIIYGRSDATLNPGGVRIGTAEIYRQVEQLPEVLESLVIGQDWPPGKNDDVRVVLFVKLREAHVLDDG